jgi:hypothetical protein
MRVLVFQLFCLGAAGMVWGAPQNRSARVTLDPSAAPAGYVARLLINETAFPGEASFRSEADSRAAMQAMLWVLHSRLRHVPEGYSQRQVADVESACILDVITAKGVKGQVEGFYRDRNGQPRMALRVQARVNYLVGIANRGQPGPVTSLLNQAQTLARNYFKAGPGGDDIFADLRKIDGKSVTGRAYAWMTDSNRFNPGGDFVRIPERLLGSLGGNRFYTLEKRVQSARQGS